MARPKGSRPPTSSGSWVGATSASSPTTTAPTPPPPVVRRGGREIRGPGPTCSYMLKQEYPWLASDKENAKLVAERTRDLFEDLTGLRAEGKLNVNFRRSPGKIAYHLPCHLKAPGPMFRGSVATSPARAAAACPRAGLQIARGTGREPRHPIQILAEAYG